MARSASVGRVFPRSRRPDGRLILAAGVALLPLLAAQGLAATPPSAVAAPAANPAPTPPPAAPAPPAVAPVAAPAAPAPPDPSLILLQQATFWRSQNVPDKATSSLRRLLELQPNNPDALGLLAQIDVEQGNVSEAQNYYTRLKELDPSNARISEVESSLRIGPIDQALLTQARTLSAASKAAQSVRAYQAAFHGSTPPPTLAVEYYEALSNVDIDGFQTARTALAAIVARNPNDTATQLAYARLLCNREFTRDIGLTRLQSLANVPSVSATARRYWRQVMLWQGPSIQSMNELKAYIAANGTDPQIAAEYDDFKQTVPSDGDQARDRGFVEISGSQWDAADADFQTAIKDNPRDWRATMMLAAIRNHQNRTQDAHDLIEQALLLKPEQKDFIIKSSGGDWSHDALVAKGLIGKPGDKGAHTWTRADTRRAAARAAVAYRRQYAEVARLADAGRYPEAERLLLKLSGGRKTSGTYVQLGNLEASAGRADAAQASFEHALNINAGDPDAAAGLARLYTQQGKPDQAQPYYAQAEDGYRRRSDARGLSAMNSLRAQQIRARADAMASSTAQVPLYQQALAIDPADPWLRLSLARALQKQGRVEEARRLMDETETARDLPTIESHIYFEQSLGDDARATAFVDRLPARSRTAQMRALQDQVALHADIARIVSLPDGRNRRAALLALAAQPDPTGQRVAAIGDALVQLGDKPSVAEAVQAQLRSGAAVTPDQRLAYSGALVAADDPDQADALIAGVDDGALQREQAIRLDDVKDTIAIAHSDQLNTENKPADAYDRLAPRLAADPNDPNLRLALSRLYAANGKPREALAISRAVLSDNEGDLGVRRQAISSAIAAKNYDFADTLVREGIRQAPDDPQMYILSANIAQAQGANLRAVHDLQKARTLRQRQLAEASN